MKVRLMFAAFAAAVTGFMSFNTAAATYRVTNEVGTEGDGQSWESPMSITNAVANATTAGDVILCKDGEYTVVKQIVITKPITVKGGYAGTDDTTLAADPVTTFNARDNSAFQSMVNVTTATGAGTSNHFERITFTRGYVRGLYKSGAADISFKNCRFYQNGGLYNPGGGFTGVGANLTGTSAVEARFEDCLFDNNARTNYPSNRNTCMQGPLYSTGFKRLYVDNCNFYTNCAIFGISNEYGQDSEGVGAIYANAQPVTVRGCRFVGNNVPARGAKGGTVRLNGNCGGSAVSNCVFTANSTTSWSTTLGAPLAVSMDTDARTVEIWGCTFAYNCAAGTTSAAGLTVTKGAAKVRNSIFYENYVSGRTAHYGADVCALGTSYLDIDYSLVTASDDDHLSCYTAANLTLGDHMVYGNPLFGTTSADAAACRSGITFTRSKLATILAFNLHENALGTGYSPALDTGDPSDPYANEPGPNGGRVNLGAYANTAEAATSSAGAPSIQDDSISVDFAADTKPTVSFTLGGLTNYNATVKIEIATNDFELGGVVAHESSSVGGKQAGNGLSLAASDLYQPGSTLYVRVTVSAAGQPDIVKYASATVTGDLPAHYGHGGGASVMHIREGANGLATGENWTDAYPDLNLAIVAMTSAKTEIWIAGKITPTMAPKTLTAQSALVIRGGFTGIEDRADQRPEGTYARLYGNGAYSLLTLANAASYPVTIERVIFDRASSRGLYKSGAGTLDVADCKFHSNGWPDSNVLGRGMYLAGGSRVSVTNCDFRGNFMSGGGSSTTKGAAIYANAVTRLYLDDSTFVTNGCNPVCGIAGGMSGRDQCGGGLLLMDGVPLTARNCRFTSNRTPIRADGGVIWLGGTSATSAFTNCVFTGNQSTYAETSMATAATGATGGMIVINLSSAAAKVDFERCTIAYNLGDALHVPGGIDVVKGAVNLHNSIIFSNVRGKLSDAGSDIEVKANGTLKMSYCRLTEGNETTGVPSARTVHEATVGSITYDNLSFGDPTFATSAQSFTNVLRYSGDYTYYNYAAAGLQFTSSIDAHLLSKQGYWDNANVFHDDTKVVSTCIDAGDRASDYTNEPQPNGHRVNLGAYGNTPYASMTPVTGSLLFIK